MDKDERILANRAIDENVKDTTARKIIRWVMECELNGFDTINPSNAYLAKKFGWKEDTVRVAISKAKKSGFIATTGTSRNRTFELNVQFLKGKMAEIIAKKPPRKRLDFSDIMILSEGDTMGLPNNLPNNSPNNLPNILPNNLPNILPNNLPNKKTQNNRGKSPSNNNKKEKKSVSVVAHTHLERLGKVQKFQSSWSLSIGASAKILEQLESVLDAEKLDNYLSFALDPANEASVGKLIGVAEKESRNIDYFLADNISRMRALL